MPSETIGVIAERYATALFELAEAQGVLDQVAGDLKTLKTMVGESADFRRLLDSPVLSRTQQAAAVTALAAAAGFSAVTANFLGVVARNRRLFALRGMVDSYLARLAARRGEISAQVASAVPLSEAQLDAVTSVLKNVFGANAAIDAVVDPGLLGGLVVRVGSRMVDSSLRTKLQHLKLAMKGVG
ncbi:MAG: F0F1 ATP synthase subunit delta [Magnetospirillum sp.]|nr:F0F1 ATP synthase subunit delta [Magnetospirillum sp.]